MGACASCLGRRERHADDENEESRLLYDGAGMHYGGFGDPALAGDDALEAQREHEALQRVVARTSNNMVDVFETAPHGLLPRGAPFAYAAHGARLARYQHLVSKLGDDDARPPTMAALDAAAAGPFVGSFADAAAMR